MTGNWHGDICLTVCVIAMMVGLVKCDSIERNADVEKARIGLQKVGVSK